MSEYDFEGELKAVWFAPDGRAATLAALRRAYAAGQASGGGSDLDRLVTLAAGIWSSQGAHEDYVHSDVVKKAAATLEALKAQAVAK